jgi:hypothetical protein
MKKLTAILGLAAALSLAGCLNQRAQLIKEIETNKTFSASKYAEFEDGRFPRINSEEKGFACRDYCINGISVMATFPLKPKGTTTTFEVLEQGGRVIDSNAKEIIVFPKDFDYKNGSIITYKDTDGKDGFDTKEELTIYTVKLTYQKDTYMISTESLK